MNTKSKNKLVFLPLGGTGEIGMNMNCYGYGSHIDDMKWLLVDVGITFGDDTLGGVDVIMPDHGFIKESRGKGLWIGVELDQGISAKKICLSLMGEGILAKETHETVIRFAPPLLIKKDEIDWALVKINKVFQEYE